MDVVRYGWLRKSCKISTLATPEQYTAAMLRMIPSMNSENAKKYHNDALAPSDYYVSDIERQGVFLGKLGARLGITGPTTKETFAALCDNRHPKTGKPLTPITRDERLVAWDLNFHAPKSVSLLRALSKIDDDHILNAFQESVRETMQEIEAGVRTRIRRNGAYDDREAGELVFAEFIHETARPTAGHHPDPHLHAHCFAFNATWDDQEKRIKAAKWRDIKIDCPFYEAKFHKRLADKLTDLGYRIRRTDRAFEIEGVPQAAIDHFSKRTDEIGRAAAKLGIKDSKRKDKLGAQTRSAKRKGLSMKELRAEWMRELRNLDTDKDKGTPIRFAPVKETKILEPGHCVDHSLDHSFERASVVDQKRILRAAYRHALDHRETSLQAIDDQLQQDPRMIRISRGTRTLCTTKDVLQEEKRMVDLARSGIGKLNPLYGGTPIFTKLKEQQETAAIHVLTTPNRVSIVMGAAGTGKTTLMQETVEKIEAVGKKVFAVAPTAEAVRVLKEEGFEKANTVAMLLADKKSQQDLKGQVIWVDEAGLLGTKDMIDLLELAKDKNARLILGGDTRQNNSVVRGDALRVLNTTGGIKAAEVNKIRRQQNKTYLEAVQDLANGKVKEAFEKLDSMSAIKEIDPMDPNTQLVDDYVAAVKKGKSALIVSPTHKQGDEVTAAIREKLRETGLLGRTEITARKLENLNFTQAEKADWRNYRVGQVIQFSQHVKGIRRASKWTVKEISERGIKISDQDGRTNYVPRGKSGSFDVYRASEIALSKGDKVRITRNGFDQEKKRLNNGMSLEVVSVKGGKISLRNTISKTTYTLAVDYGHIAHGHVITSYASQGKTVDQVFISQPSATFAATDMKQFYVSVSRGKQSVTIYTDSKEELLHHASEGGDRQSAIELVSGQKTHEKHMQHKEHVAYDAKPKSKSREKSPSYAKVKDYGYEPGI